MEYIYENITSSPKLKIVNELGILSEGIHFGVSVSLMTNKSIEWCRWDEETKILTISFETSLSQSDKTKLDSIVENNI